MSYYANKRIFSVPQGIALICIQVNTIVCMEACPGDVTIWKYFTVLFSNMNSSFIYLTISLIPISTLDTIFGVKSEHRLSFKKEPLKILERTIL